MQPMKLLKQILQLIATISFLAGTSAMFAAKIAAWQGGVFLSRAEHHWFNDSITAFLLSINLLLLMVILLKNTTSD
ncbi:MAG TPA: hypothetical protein VJI96_01380 [Candidatus Andersenbacteria bacterium]|nr:hypothetical protein [Candidatus Andersenbacteria bacterium]